MEMSSEYNQFLVLGIKIAHLKDTRIPKGFLKFPKVFFGDDEIIYLVILAKSGDQSNSEFSDGMLLISSNRPLSISKGMHYAHAIKTALPILEFCIEKNVDNISILPIKSKAYKNLPKPLTIKNLQKYCRDEIIELYYDPDLFRVSFGTCRIESPRILRPIMPYLRRYATDPSFEKGSGYLYQSMKDLGIDICDWGQDDYNQDFDIFVPVSNAESALLNSFKCIEAIIGEPSKNRTREKITKRLEDWGANPDENVGYSEKENIIDKILKFHKLRDSIAAHGLGKYQRKLKLSEIFDVQSLARHILLTPLYKRKKQ